MNNQNWFEIAQTIFNPIKPSLRAQQVNNEKKARELSLALFDAQKEIARLERLVCTLSEDIYICTDCDRVFENPYHNESTCKLCASCYERELNQRYK